MRIGAAAAVLALLGALPAGEAFMYRPAAGLVWDPSCFTWEGKTYCYFMYICGIGTPGCTQNSSHYGHGLVSLARDGVHFETHSAFNAEYGDVGWFKCQAARIREVDGYRFVMNHGTWGAVAGPDDPAESIPGSRGCPNATKQCLRFLKSKDAVTCKPPRYCWHLGCIL